jgi:two-component system sensor histidine kinase UhpB
LSLRYQINLRILLSVAVLLLFGGSTVIWQARRSVTDEVQASVKLALQLIELGVAQSREAPEQNSAWLSKITSLKATRHLRIEMQRKAGQTLYFERRREAKKTASLPPQWFVNAVAADYPQAEYRLAGADGKPVKIVIEADPLDEISEAWQETRSFFISIGSLVAMIFLAVNLVFNKALQSVAAIIEGLQGIEGGDYEKQLPLFSTHEFNTIAKAINHMAAALDAARRENSALAQHSLEIQEEERQRLSQELHDEFGQSLTAIKVMAVTAQKPAADKEKIGAAIASVCDHLFAALRSMMRSLHPAALTELGLRAALEDLADQWRARNPGLQLTLCCGGGIDILDGKKAIQLFRVIQECLTNVVRHAEARHVGMELRLVDDPLIGGRMLHMSVKDDGKGCDVGSINKGFGLLGMRERVNSMGGRLALHSRPQHGMVVEAAIPVET